MTYYTLTPAQTVHVPRDADAALLGELLSGYTQGTAFTVIADAAPNTVMIGARDADGARAVAEIGTVGATVLDVTERGVRILGTDTAATVRGWITMLERIEYDRAEKCFRLPCGQVMEAPHLAFRSVHLCVFPETSLMFLKKCIRTCGIAKYSHIVLEFWGMLCYDCLRELAWPFAHSKDDIRPLIAEARALGMEIIPMFNHLGHASASREMYGKHVVLDQNPRYEPWFRSHGWEWDFESEEVRALLTAVRRELIELCGEGSYFHLGCDEAYSLGYGDNRARALCDYLNGIAAELKEQGRRAIIWGDMLLLQREYADEPQKYSCNMRNEDIYRTLIEGLDKEIIIADWQYHLTCDVWKSSTALTRAGFEVICCPWDTQANARAAIVNADTQCLHGIMYTTWHTLAKGFPIMLYAGHAAYSGETEVPSKEVRFSAAETARRVLPAQGVYENAGWSEAVVGPGL